MRYRSRTRFILEGIEGAFLSIIVIVSWPLLRRWVENWGSVSAERVREWPGDGLVDPMHSVYTRAISIASPAEIVWKWIVQFGFGRAGFYSYELLERLVGIPVTNVESVDPMMQTLVPGDEILLHPKAPGIPVAYVQHGKYVCFGVVDKIRSSNPVQDPNRSWSFYIEPSSDSECRLVLRGCLEPLRHPSFGKYVALALESPIDFVMEQRMLRTIKRLSEIQTVGDV